MIRYEVTSDKPGLIDGIGEFSSGETKVLSETQVTQFRRKNGTRLVYANLPSYVTLTVSLSDDVEEENKEVTER